ncbi:MAG: hypothetical protein ABIR79_21000 [Candidatus Binatia bacterium]
MHPNSLDLEAFAVGEPNAKVEAHLKACDACRSFVEKLGALPVAKMPELTSPKVSTTLRLGTVISLIVPLAAAALFFFVLRRPPPGDVVTPLPRPSIDQPEPETTFKGALPIAIIRERSGEQVRFTSSTKVRPGDRLRVEVALDREQVISAGVLGDDGSWLELMPETTRAPGTHFSEKSARVDSEPLRGTVLAGPPAQVALARATRNFGGVASLRLEWEAP